MTPILSVLIPTVPARREAAWKLFDKITAQAEGQPVEVLVLLDNKKRSTGLKRQSLLCNSVGEYVAFVDDDDDVSDDYIAKILEAAKGQPQVIVFDTDCSLNGSAPVRIYHSLGAPNQQFHPIGFVRGAWQMHAWMGTIARTVAFRDLQNGEDWEWCKRLNDLCKNQAKIDEVLYHYRYNHETTEASK